MTELTSVVDTGDQLPSQQIARTIRARMAVDQITGLELARAIGLTQRSFSRRYRGEIDWSVDELSLLAQALGVTFAELTDHRAVSVVTPMLPAPGGGRGTAEYAIRDSNPEPADLKSAGATILQLPRRPRPISSERAASTQTGWGATVVRLEARPSWRTTTSSTWRDQVSS